MLILVPPSESKRPPPESGPPVDFGALSFPELNATRRRIAKALIETSGRDDAFDRLRVRPSMAPLVAQNTWLLELPAMPVLDVYTGPLHVGLDARGLSKVGAERAERSLLVLSALWGALRPSDRIPPYRLRLWADLVGVDRLDTTWRAVLPSVLREAAAEGIVLDLRSPEFQQVGRPRGLADRTVVIRAVRGVRGVHLGDVIAKRTRGEIVHHLLESAAEPSDLSELAEIIETRWPVAVDPPELPGKPWTMTVTVG